MIVRGRKDIDLPYRKAVLPNGLTVILYEDHRLPQVAVNLWYHVGSKNEAPGRTGFAHLFEHLMFQGSEHYNDDFFKPLEEIGARLNGSTAEDRTNYWEVVPTAYLERALWLESDRMGWLLPAIDQAKFDNQREVVKNERRQTMDNQPYGVAEEACLESVYPEGHPYHHSVIGSMEDLDAATLDDVKDFFRRFYTPSNASLCVAGDIDPEDVLEAVTRYFGAIPRGPIVSPLKPDIPVLTRPTRVQVADRVVLPRIYLQWPTATQLTNSDATLSVLSFILSTGKDSRLVRRLQVEEQLVQALWSHHMGGEVAGHFQVVATAQQGISVDRIEETCWEEIRRVKEEGVDPDEVRAAVDTITVGVLKRLQMVGGFGSISDMLNYYQVFAGDPGALPRELARYEAVTADGVREAARRYLHDDRYAMVVVQPSTRSAPPPKRPAMPAKGSDGRFHFPEVNRRTLSNGMELWVLTDTNFPLVTLSAVVRAGSGLDPKGKPGLAQFTAGLMDESVEGGGPLEMARRQKKLATSLSTTVDGAHSALSLSLLADHFPDGLALLADVLLRPDFRNEDVERVRREMMAGLIRRMDDPSELGDRTLKAMLYGAGSPHGHPTDGTPSSLRGFKGEEVKTLYRSLYRPDRTMFVAVGDISADEAAREVEGAFAEWTKASETLPEEKEAVLPGGLYVVDKPGAPQSYIAAAKSALSKTDPRYPAFLLFNAVLGGQFTSRINMNLREDKGYTYGAQSYLEPKRGVMPWILYTSVQVDKTAESLVELIGEIRAIGGDRPVEAGEFAKARDNILLRYPQSFETQGQLAAGLTTLWVYDLPWDYHKRMVSALENMTLDRVRAAGEEVLTPDDLVWVVVGDRERLLSSLAGLEIGEPKIVAAPGQEEIRGGGLNRPG